MSYCLISKKSCKYATFCHLFLSSWQQTNSFHMARLFNKKHTQTLLYKGIVERSFSLKNGYIEPIIGLILLVFSLQANNTASSITFSLCFPLTQAYIIKVGHKQSVLNDTVFFEFSFCMKLCNLIDPLSKLHNSLRIYLKTDSNNHFQWIMICGITL